MIDFFILTCIIQIEYKIQKKKLMNPFKYGAIASDKDFYGRKTLHIVILGERRTGKSSADYEAVII